MWGSVETSVRGQPLLRRPGQPLLRRPGQPLVRRPGQPLLRRPGHPLLRRPGQPLVRGHPLLRRPGQPLVRGHPLVRRPRAASGPAPVGSQRSSVSSTQLSGKPTYKCQRGVVSYSSTTVMGALAVVILLRVYYVISYHSSRWRALG